MNAEVSRGMEALNHLPFTEVALGKEMGVTRLGARTRRIIGDNFAFVTENMHAFSEDIPSIDVLINIRNRMINRSGLCGVTLSELNVNKIYTMGDKSTFSGLISHLIDVWKFNAKDPEMQRGGLLGTRAIGSMSDLAALLDESKFASYPDGLAVIRSELIIRGVSHYDVGMHIDDILHLRSRDEGHIDPMSDRDAAMGLMALYESTSSAENRLGFELGLRHYQNTQPLLKNMPLIISGHSDN